MACPIDATKLAQIPVNHVAALAPSDQPAVQSTDLPSIDQYFKSINLGPSGVVSFDQFITKERSFLGRMDPPKRAAIIGRLEKHPLKNEFLKVPEMQPGIEDFEAKTCYKAIVDGINKVYKNLSSKKCIWLRGGFLRYILHNWFRECENLASTSPGKMRPDLDILIDASDLNMEQIYLIETQIFIVIAKALSKNNPKLEECYFILASICCSLRRGSPADGGDYTLTVLSVKDCPALEIVIFASLKRMSLCVLDSLYWHFYKKTLYCAHGDIRKVIHDNNGYLLTIDDPHKLNGFGVARIISHTVCGGLIQGEGTFAKMFSMRKSPEEIEAFYTQVKKSCDNHNWGCPIAFATMLWNIYVLSGCQLFYDRAIANAADLGFQQPNLDGWALKELEDVNSDVQIDWVENQGNHTFRVYEKDVYWFLPSFVLQDSDVVRILSNAKSRLPKQFLQKQFPGVDLDQSAVAILLGTTNARWHRHAEKLINSDEYKRPAAQRMLLAAADDNAIVVLIRIFKNIGIAHPDIFCALVERTTKCRTNITLQADALCQLAIGESSKKNPTRSINVCNWLFSKCSSFTYAWNAYTHFASLYAAVPDLLVAKAQLDSLPLTDLFEQPLFIHLSQQARLPYVRQALRKTAPHFLDHSFYRCFDEQWITLADAQLLFPELIPNFSFVNIHWLGELYPKPEVIPLAAFQRLPQIVALASSNILSMTEAHLEYLCDIFDNTLLPNSAVSNELKLRLLTRHRVADPALWRACASSENVECYAIEAVRQAAQNNILSAEDGADVLFGMIEVLLPQFRNTVAPHLFATSVQVMHDFPLRLTKSHRQWVLYHLTSLLLSPDISLETIELSHEILENEEDFLMLFILKLCEQNHPPAFHAKALKYLVPHLEKPRFSKLGVKVLSLATKWHSQHEHEADLVKVAYDVLQKWDDLDSLFVRIKILLQINTPEIQNLCGFIFKTVKPELEDKEKIWRGMIENWFETLLKPDNPDRLTPNLAKCISEVVEHNHVHYPSHASWKVGIGRKLAKYLKARTEMHAWRGETPDDITLNLTYKAIELQDRESAFIQADAKLYAELTSLALDLVEACLKRIDVYAAFIEISLPLSNVLEYAHQNATAVKQKIVIKNKLRLITGMIDSLPFQNKDCTNMLVHIEECLQKIIDGYPSESLLIVPIVHRLVFATTDPKTPVLLKVKLIRIRKFVLGNWKNLDFLKHPELATEIIFFINKLFLSCLPQERAANQVCQLLYRGVSLDHPHSILEYLSLARHLEPMLGKASYILFLHTLYKTAGKTLANSNYPIYKPKIPVFSIVAEGFLVSCLVTKNQALKSGHEKMIDSLKALIDGGLDQLIRFPHGECYATIFLNILHLQKEILKKCHSREIVELNFTYCEKLMVIAEKHPSNHTHIVEIIANLSWETMGVKAVLKPEQMFKRIELLQRAFALLSQADPESMLIKKLYVIMLEKPSWFEGVPDGENIRKKIISDYRLDAR